MFDFIASNEISLTTPAVLFSAISLVMLAYTNRFIAYTQLVRNLKDRYDSEPEENARVCENILAQIETLRQRLKLTRRMQWFGSCSLFLCVLSMFVIYIGFQLVAVYLFAVALLLLVISLMFSVWEIQISSHSLELHLTELKKSHNLHEEESVSHLIISKTKKGVKKIIH